jgi:hypothetical protein
LRLNKSSCDNSPGLPQSLLLCTAYLNAKRGCARRIPLPEINEFFPTRGLHCVRAPAAPGSPRSHATFLSDQGRVGRHHRRGHTEIPGQAWTGKSRAQPGSRPFPSRQWSRKCSGSDHAAPGTTATWNSAGTAFLPHARVPAPFAEPHSPSTIPAVALVTSRDIVPNTTAALSPNVHRRLPQVRRCIIQRSVASESEELPGSIGDGRWASGARAAILGQGRGNFRSRESRALGALGDPRAPPHARALLSLPSVPTFHTFLSVTSSSVPSCRRYKFCFCHVQPTMDKRNSNCA